MDPMETEIQDAINKHLTSEVGERLRNRLEIAAEDREELISLQSKYKAKMADNVELCTKLAKHEELDKREADIANRQERVTSQENAYALRLRDIEIKAEKRITQVLQDTMLGLVRNTEYRKSIFGQTPMADNSGYVTSQQESSDVTDRAE